MATAAEMEGMARVAAAGTVAMAGMVVPEASAATVATVAMAALGRGQGWWVWQGWRRRRPV